MHGIEDVDEEAMRLIEVRHGEPYVIDSAQSEPVGNADLFSTH
jgi:hypothetical protein